MKAAVLVVLTTTVLASAEPQESHIVLTPDDAQRCAAEGGCGVVTRAWLEQQLRRAYEAGAVACQNSI